MKWYLHPLDQEFSQWSPRSIAKHLGNVSLPVAPPTSKLTIGDQAIYPLIDDGGSPEPYQNSIRSITVGQDVATASYTYENKPLADYKEQRKGEVNLLREEKLYEDFTFGGVVYQADERSQERLDRARASALAAIIGGSQVGNYRWHGEDVDFFWIAKDNSQNVMDAQTTLTFGNGMVAREGMLIAAGASIKAAIDAAETHAAVTAIDITTGWPG